VRGPKRSVGQIASQKAKPLTQRLLILVLASMAVAFTLVDLSMIQPCLAERYSLAKNPLSDSTVLPIMYWDQINYSIVFNPFPGRVQVLLHYTYHQSNSRPPLETFQTLSMIKGRTLFAYWVMIPPASTAGIFLHTRIEVKDEQGSDFIDVRHIPILEPEEPRFRFMSIEIGSINFSDVTIPMKIGLDIYFPIRSDYLVQYDSIGVQAQDPSGRIYTGILRPMSRFNYVGYIEWKNVQLLGRPYDFPFDSYSLNLSFRAYPYELKFHTYEAPPPFISSPREYLTWNLERRITVIEELQDSVLKLEINLSRKEATLWGMTYPILSLFVLLGAGTLLDIKNNFQHRLSLYMTLAIFALTLSSYQKTNVPLEVRGFSVLDIIFNMILLVILVYLIFSIFARRLGSSYENRPWLACLSYVVSNVAPSIAATWLAFRLIVFKTEYYQATLVEIFSRAGASSWAALFVGSIWIFLLVDAAFRCRPNRARFHSQNDKR